MVNTSFQLAPWADVLFAMDRKWWAYHLERVRKEFAGERVSVQRIRDVSHVPAKFQHFGNSGAAAIAFAALRGAARIGLLGYDCHRRGKSHWHGDHPRPLGNALSLPKWPQQFRQLAKSLNGAAVINCSPGTALHVFPTGELEAFLNGA